MEFAKKNLLANLRKGTASKAVAKETNENDWPSYKKEPNESFTSTTKAVGPKKKILAEKNDHASFQEHSAAPFHATPQEKPVVVSASLDDPSQISPFSLMESRAGKQKLVGSDYFRSLPYDPLTNYLSPRPEFLRYNPNRRREILRRIEGERRNDEEGSEFDSGPFTDPMKLSSEESSLETSPSSQTRFEEREAQEREQDGSDAEDCEMEKEEIEEKPWSSGMLWKLLLLFGVLLSSFCYMCPLSSAPFPSSQANRVFQRSRLRIHDELVMGLSNMCLNVCTGEITCGDEGISNRVLGSDDLIRSKGSKEKGLHIGISETHVGDILTRGGEINAALTILDNPTGRVELEGKELLEGMKLEAEGNEEQLEYSKTLRADDYVVQARIREDSSSPEFLELEQFSRRDEVNGEDEIIAAELMESDRIHEAPQDSHNQSDSLDSSAVQDAEHELLGPFEIMFEDEKQGTETGELTESSGIAHSQFDSNIPSDNQRTEDYEFPNIFDSELEQEQIAVCIYKDNHQMLRMLFYLSLVLIGTLGSFYKYFRRSYEKSSAPFSPLSIVPTERTSEDKNNLVDSIMEHMEDKGNFLNSNSVSLNYFSDGDKKLYGTQPPTVELLGEFSIVEEIVSQTCPAGNLQKKAGEDSQLSESQRRRSTRKNLLSSANKVHSSPSESLLAVESSANGSSTTKQKLLRKEDVRGKGEAVKVITTPLRRSSRLQNRVATP